MMIFCHYPAHLKALELLRDRPIHLCANAIARSPKTAITDAEQSIQR